MKPFVIRKYSCDYDKKVSVFKSIILSIFIKEKFANDRNP